MPIPTPPISLDDWVDAKQLDLSVASNGYEYDIAHYSKMAGWVGQNAAPVFWMPIPTEPEGLKP